MSYKKLNILLLSILSITASTATSISYAQNIDNTEQLNNKRVILVKDKEGYIDIKADPVRYNRISNLAKEKLGSTPDRILENTNIGMYEVVINGEKIFYISKNEKFFMVDGALVSFTDMKENIISSRTMKLLPFNAKELNLKDAIKTVIGDGSRKIVTFEDPNCGYCKLFNQEKVKLTNVTIYTFIIPILGDDSLAKSKNIWCSNDREQAWDSAMNKNVVLPSPNCDTTAIDRNIEVSKKFKVHFTPTIFLPSGERIPGATKANVIEEKLSK